MEYLFVYTPGLHNYLQISQIYVIYIIDST